MPMSALAALICALPSSSKPVVPMIMFTPYSRHLAMWISVPSGRVKSISTCAPLRAARSSVIFTPQSRPRKAPASWPMASLPARSSAVCNSQPSAPRTASISMRPMRPVLPAMAILIVISELRNYLEAGVLAASGLTRAGRVSPPKRLSTSPSKCTVKTLRSFRTPARASLYT